jgi:FtsH-binding integral membrane protein
MSNCSNYFGKVFAHVAAALGIAAGSAEYIHILDRFIKTKSSFLLFFANLAILLVLVVGVFFTSPGSPLKYVFFVLFAFWIGQSLQPLVQKLETKNKIKDVLFLTTGIFVGMMALGFYDDQNLLGFGSYLMASLAGLIIAQIFLLLFYSKDTHSWITFIGTSIFAVLTAYDTQVLKKNKQLCNNNNKRGIPPDYPKESINFFLDFVNLFSYIGSD